MELLINDEKVVVPKEVKTIEHLIQHLKLKNPFIIVEQNDYILKNDEHATSLVKDGDKIELVHFVGGG